MKVAQSLALLAGVVALAAGCSQSPMTVRGQSPAPQIVGDAEGPILGTAPGYGDRPKWKHHQKDFKAFSGYRNQVSNTGGWYDESDYGNRKRVYDVVGAGGGCPACDGGMHCPAGGCPHCGYGCGHGHGKPHHYHTYAYKWPQNLVYPEPTVPAGMVQYPYYTLRGPTDFFMK